MTKRNEAAFDDWWASLLAEDRLALDKVACRRAFIGGFCAGGKPEYKRFAFTAGKRRVTVLAPTYGAAKRKADVALTKRAEAAGLSPPKSGWRLQPAAGRDASQ